MNLYLVSYGSKIIGSNDFVYVIAESEKEALKIAKPMLNTHKLYPDFLNNYSRYHVELSSM